MNHKGKHVTGLKGNKEGIQERQERKETSVQSIKKKFKNHSFLKKIQPKTKFHIKGGLKETHIIRKQVLKDEMIKTIEI